MKNLLMVLGLIVSFASVSFGQTKSEMRDQMNGLRDSAESYICDAEYRIDLLEDSIVEAENLMDLVGPAAINASSFSEEDKAMMLAADADMRASLDAAIQLKADALAYLGQAISYRGLGDVYRDDFEYQETAWAGPGAGAISNYTTAEEKAYLAVTTAIEADIICQYVITYAVMMQTTLGL
jgi:hypothetical protein